MLILVNIINGTNNTINTIVCVGWTSVEVFHPGGNLRVIKHFQTLVDGMIPYPFYIIY